MGVSLETGLAALELARVQEGDVKDVDSRLDLAEESFKTALEAD